MNRHKVPTNALIHAESQLGKSRLLAQCYPAWLLGHDPMMRIALATYNVTRSQAHSKAVIGIMNLPVYKAIFTSDDVIVPPSTSKEKWSTNKRATEATDAHQVSFNPVGLQSGLTGSGFDCFPAGTMIATEFGSVDIKDLHEAKTPARVLSFNHKTKQIELKPIEATREIIKDELIEITTTSGKKIRCTPWHRIYVNGRYTAAQSVRKGDRLVKQGSDEDTVAMVRRIRSKGIAVYDIQVKDNRNFFAEEILVHNCLIIDDPYADQKEAFSETTRHNLQDFWEYTVKSRLSEHTNVFGMFHRYYHQDLAGYLLDKGNFDYLRYASVADGDYIHEETGQRFPDPLGRAEGEYISERRGESYYADKRKEPRVWNAMFQGRPSAVEGDFFKVGQIQRLTGNEIDQEAAKCILWVRAWDNAATDGAGDYSAGAKIGIQPDGRVVIRHGIAEQVDTSGRMELQKSTAMGDGRDVPVLVPQEVAAAGKDVVFFTQQSLQGFTVIPRSVVTASNVPGSTAKTRRAYNFSIAVNSGKVMIADDGGDWVETYLRVMRNFPMSGFDDPIDAMADGYNFLFEQLSRGMVMHKFDPLTNLVTWDRFSATFGNCHKISDRFNVYAAVKITADASTPNSAVIVAHAPEIAEMPETLFLVAEYKNWTADYNECFDWLRLSLDQYCEKPSAATVWLAKQSEPYLATIRQKIKARNVLLFEGDDVAGLTELNWYMSADESIRNRFGYETFGSRFYGIVRDLSQLAEPTNASGLVGLRQEARTWGFKDNGQPNALGAVGECLRMIAWNFRTRGQRRTVNEAVMFEVEKILPAAKVQEYIDKDDAQTAGDLATRREILMKQMEQKVKAREDAAVPDWSVIG